MMLGYCTADGGTVLQEDFLRFAWFWIFFDFLVEINDSTDIRH